MLDDGAGIEAVILPRLCWYGHLRQGAALNNDHRVRYKGQWTKPM